MARASTARERGTAFVLVAILTVTSVGVVGAYFTTSLSKVNHVRQHESELAAFNAAEAGLNMAIEHAWTQYQNATPSERLEVLQNLFGVPVEGEEEGGNEEQGDASLPLGRRTDLRELIAEKRMGKSLTRVFTREIRVEPGLHIDVEFVAVGRNDRASRTLVAVVRFGNKTSRVFDSAYFINNFGWLWGSSITVNGSVRANGNFSIRNATVNGDVFACENEEISAEGTIDGTARYKTIDWYNANYGDPVRPTNPSATPEDTNGNGILDPGEDRNGNGVLDDFDYLDGYDGEPEYFEQQAPVEMPYLGDLSTYRTLALTEGGTLSQGGEILVQGVHGDGEGESENLALVGTAENPIVISGPVVIENDVVIKGYVTGQGTIYAGRNIHIIGNVVYVNPPSWPKPMENVDEVRQANRQRDLLGLSAKGSIIMGDYTTSTWQSHTGYYQRPPFTVPYVVDPTDGENGYVSYYDGQDRPVFDGDYRAFDGGEKEDNDGGFVSRRFFESSFSDDYVHSLSEGYLTHVDAVLYTNHLLSGRIGKSVFNGTLVARDEAIIYSSSVAMNYDVRVRYNNYEFLEAFLPQEPMRKVLFFRDEL